MNDEEKDLFIKSKMKDDYIPKKTNSLLNNPMQVIEKRGGNSMDDNTKNNILETEEKDIKESKKKSKNVALKRTLATAACAVILLGGGNIYATTKGYDNIFFMIKYLITGEKPTNNKEGILSDRDITMSYQPIQITENMKILIPKMQIKDNQAKLIVSVNRNNAENDDKLPLKYKVYDEKENILCEQVSNENGEWSVVTFTDELLLKNYSEENKELKLEMFKSNEELIVTILIDLENKEIKVLGEDKEIEKISEIELKEFLGYVSGLKRIDNTLDKNETLIEVAIATNKVPVTKYGYEVIALNDFISSMCGETIENFKSGEMFIKKKINGVEYINFKNPAGMPDSATCIDISDISYANGCYTVTYTYCYLGEMSLFDYDIKNLDMYQNTASLNINDDPTFTKFHLRSLETPVIIHKAGEDENKDDSIEKPEEKPIEKPENNPEDKPGDSANIEPWPDFEGTYVLKSTLKKGEKINPKTWKTWNGKNWLVFNKDKTFKDTIFSKMFTNELTESGTYELKNNMIVLNYSNGKVVTLKSEKEDHSLAGEIGEYDVSVVWYSKNDLMNGRLEAVGSWKFGYALKWPLYNSKKYELDELYDKEIYGTDIVSNFTIEDNRYFEYAVVGPKKIDRAIGIIEGDNSVDSENDILMKAMVDGKEFLYLNYSKSDMHGNESISFTPSGKNGYTLYYVRDNS